jgi:flagellin-like protein
MKRVRIRKDEKAVSPVIAVILMVAITVVLAGVLYVWVTSLSGADEEVAPTASLKLTTRDELNDTAQDQDFAMLSHRSGDNMKWSDMKFQISDDGGTFFIIEPDVTQTNLNVLMTKGDNIGDKDLFEVGESIYFAEDGADWDAADDFYLKIVHNPSKSTIYDESIDLV